MKIICRGAESIIYFDKFKGQNVLVKERIKKSYRISVLDERIRKERTRREEKLLTSARRADVQVPRIWKVTKYKIIMEAVKGERVKDILNRLPKKDRLNICKQIGESIARLHSAGIIHGDLTTSNIIWTNKLYFIDFGLGKISSKTEDQAVDFYLLYEALKSTHFKHLNENWQNILNAYKQKYSKAKQVLKRIKKIKKRRRYK
jgi:TP53 regulating kinase-like protein